MCLKMVTRSESRKYILAHHFSLLLFHIHTTSEYDICAVIENNADSFCPIFPNFQPCHCPLLKGHFQLNEVKLDVPSFGVLDNLMMGAYKARAEFYGKSNANYKLGCIDFTFTFIKG